MVSSYDQDEHENGLGLEKDQMSRYANDAFKKSAEAMAKADPEKTEKVFGLLEMPSGAAAAVYSLYNLATEFAGQHVIANVGKITKKLAGSLNVKDVNTQNKIAAGASLVAIGAIKSAAYLPPLIATFKEHRKTRQHLVHAIAPVLDDLKGKHSVGALYRVSEAENEVIYVHRRRLEKIHHNDNFGNAMRLVANSGVNILLDVGMLSKVWKGEAPTNASFQQTSKAEINQKTAELGRIDNPSDGKQLLRSGVVTLVPQIASMVEKGNNKKFIATLQPYTALDMIVELEKQVTGDPKARTYVLPRSILNSKSRAPECPLEEYLIRICIQHQKDMADISAEHTEIRDALREDLAAAVKPIAEALRKGDMNALQLIRLVGEGKIIKNRGRSIAGADDVAECIERDAPKQSAYMQRSSRDYYKNSSFTRDDLKEIFKTLEGEERIHFASPIPDAVLIEAGVSEKEVKSIREATAHHYHHMLAEDVAGIYAVDLKTKSDDELKKQGHSKTEIEALRSAFKKIEQKGEEAMHDLKAGPGRENGIEHLITNWAVPRIRDDKEYYGTVIQKGKHLLEHMADEHEAKKGHKADKSGSRDEADFEDEDETPSDQEVRGKHTKGIVKQMHHKSDHHRAERA